MNYFLLVALLLLSGPTVAGSPQDVGSEAADLATLLPYLDDDARTLPEKAGRSGSCSVRLLASAVGYRRDPDRHRNDSFGALVIDDYAKRRSGKFSYVEPDEVTAIVDAAMVAPEGVVDERVKAVIGFCALREKNLWVATEKLGPISLARLMRGVALSLLLRGTDEDPLAIANGVDANTASSQRPPGI